MVRLRFFDSRRILFLPLLVLGCGLADGGVVVSRTSKGIQFSEALSVTINGKDKVLVLGSEPKLNSPVSKLPSRKLDGSLILDRRAGAFFLSSSDALVYIFPEGLPKKEVPSVAAAWTGANISFKKSKSDKSPDEIPAASLIAFLADGVHELVDLCADDRLLSLIGGADGAFATKLDLMAATVARYPTDPAVGPMQKNLERAMVSRYQQFESGTENLEALTQALKLAELSQVVYPNVAEQARLRDQIRGTKAWLDRRVAILRAFAAGSAWDQFLLGGRKFEKYEQAFPDLANLRMKALQASLEAHKHSGEELLAEREFEAAYREFRTAGLRQPSDKLLQQRVLMSWTDYSREVAMDEQKNRKRLGRGEQEILNQAIQFASNYKSENKVDLALKSILDAEAIDPNSLPMLLKKAEILGAQGQYAQAFVTLDKYDLCAIDEERQKSSTLRNELLFKQRSSLEDIKDHIQKDWSSGSYRKLHELAMQGLRAKDDDAELLYHAGVSSLIAREPKQGQTFLARYLDVTDTLDADVSQRARVRSLLAGIQDTNVSETGEPNWLSGMRLPSNVFYCPVSLAFQPKIERIDASNKMHVNYEWRGDQLSSIVPTFDKADKATGERRISFVYSDVFPQVYSVSDGDSMLSLPPTADPDERLRRSSLVILNNPYINPDALEKLTGKNITVGIAGNRFFEPFVWDKVHYFRFKYDFRGRVAEAAELTGWNGAPTNFVLSFEWDGLQLAAVKGFEGSDAKHRSKLYERIMRYEDGRLASEEIQSGSKTSRIKYNYNGNRLMTAAATNDPTLDDRSRQVTFR